MLKITFKYRDQYSHGEWNVQTCVVHSIKECKKIYGLGKDCDYKIIKIEEINDKH